MKRHVAVLMGGLSAEREISLRSGEACAAALEEKGYLVSRVDVGEDIASCLAQMRPDVAFNALHGKYGEDGCVQGLLELLHIPYTHSGVLASSVAMNKEVAKTLMAAAGVPTPQGRVVHRLEAAKGHVLPPPYVLKPVSEGSSFGVFIVEEHAQRPPLALSASDWSHGDFMLAERFIPGRELTCAVMGDRPLDVIEILAADGGWYDYHAKYAKGGSKHVLPAVLKPNIYQQVQQLALEAHRALGCRGVSRADFRYDDRPNGTGDLLVLEVNTQPGMTETSLVPEMAAYAGFSFGELVQWMVEDASCNR
ncbi:MAG: D-alanine--D-alanine ligase [Methylocystis sp.]